MRIGILTFHSQLNYGGVLQCWALQTALEKMGHKVVVLDLWRTSGNRALLGPFGSLSFKQWLKLIARSLVKGSRDFSFAIRHWRTIRFVRTKLHLSRFHFYQWTDLRRPLDLDCVVVGSDQVWHCGDWGDPRPFLLDGAPSIPAISYAASFGINAIPQFLSNANPSLTNVCARPVYTSGLKRFAAISCREKEGVDICANLGFSARWVCDPIILEPDLFACHSSKSLSRPFRNRLLCYFLKHNISSILAQLESWSEQKGWFVDVFGPGDTPWYRGCTNSNHNARIQFHIDAGPLEFLKAIHQTDACISDSFHAFVLSLLCGVSVKALRPDLPKHRQMSSRIEELAQSFCEGHVWASDLSTALADIENGAVPTMRRLQLESFRNQSLEWLKSELEHLR